MCSTTDRSIRAVIVMVLLGYATPALRADELHLESATLPAPFLHGAQVDVVIEASGVEPIGDGRRIVVAHDKDPALHVVEVATGQIIGQPLTSPRFPKKNEGGPKWEGMARDSEGNYYLIGAHNGKTEAERATKSVLIRFRISDGESPAIDDSSVTTWHIGRGLEEALRSEGLAIDDIGKRKIEGLTIRESKTSDGSLRKEMLIGLREPKDKVRVFAAEISGSPGPESELQLKPAFSFSADPREGQASELTSLEYLPELHGFLVITASEDTSNVFHGNTLWFVSDLDFSKARKVATFEVAMKAEGLAILGSEKREGRTAVKLLITYDNDPHATHIPSRMQQVTLVSEAGKDRD
jgi:hypothetical protein